MKFTKPQPPDVAELAHRVAEIEQVREEKAALDAAERRRAVLIEPRENIGATDAATRSSGFAVANGPATSDSSEVDPDAIVTSLTMEDAFMRKSTSLAGWRESEKTDPTPE